MVTAQSQKYKTILRTNEIDCYILPPPNNGNIFEFWLGSSASGQQLSGSASHNRRMFTLQPWHSYFHSNAYLQGSTCAHTQNASQA